MQIEPQLSERAPTLFLVSSKTARWQFCLEIDWTALLYVSTMECPLLGIKSKEQADW